MQIVGVLGAARNFVGTINAGNSFADQRSFSRRRPRVLGVVIWHGLGSFPGFGSLHYCPANACIGSTAAEVSGKPVLDFFGRGMGMLIKKSFAGHHKSRCAETALLGVVVNERLLHRMQATRLSKAFYRGDRLGLSVDGEH